MTDTEKAALERRIDELCQENERLRQLADGAVNEADRLTHDAAALQIENAKLRELAQRLFTEYRYIRVRPRRMYLEHETRMRIIEDEMRSLGIEVDG